MTLDNRHKLARPYWARPGFALVTDPDDGGAGGTEDDEGDDDEPEEDDDPDEGKTEDELRAELKVAREALSKASGSSKARRDAVKKLKRELEEARAGGAPKADDDDAAPDLDAARRDERQKSDRRVKLAEARGALRGAGIDAARLDRAVKLVDLDDLDVDDEGKVDGLDDALETLRAEWPELFAKATRKRRDTSGPEDRDGGSSRDDSRLTPSQRQARQLTGRR